MAYPESTPPLDAEETQEFLERLAKFKLTDEQKAFYKDALVRYKESEEKEKDWEWSIKISHIENGFLLEGFNDNLVKTHWAVTENEMDEEGHMQDEAGMRADVACKLLYEILEYFGLSGSKHDSKRVRVEIEESGDNGEGDKEN